MDNRPIGIFDSGVGGLTVLQKIKERLPYESIIYFGDTARAPYGTKGPETIIRYSLENAQFLNRFDIKLLVIACNTASALAASAVKAQCSVPVVEVVSAGVQAVLAATKNQQIGLIGTKGTIYSGLYQQRLLAAAPKAKIFAQACPLLVPLIEERLFDHPATQAFVDEYLCPLLKAPIDTLLLGCTHYPLLRSLFVDKLGEQVAIVDSAHMTAHFVQKMLQQLQIAALPGNPSYQFFASDDPKHFAALASHLLQDLICCEHSGVA